MADDDKTWTQRHSGPIAAAVIGSFLIGAGAWAINMDRTMVRIETLLVGIENDAELACDLDKRVTFIENTRYKRADAKEIDARLKAVEDIQALQARDIADIQDDIDKITRAK